MDILVVDDDQDVLDLLRDYLQAEGHAVSLADRTAKALECLQQANPTLVFLDVRLGQEDGIDLLKRIRKDFPRVAVVMMTGFKDAELVVEAFREGALDCVLKPFNFEYLKLHILSRFKAA